MVHHLQSHCSTEDVRGRWHHFGGRWQREHQGYNANVAKFWNERATLWHQRFGHFNMASLKKLKKMIHGMNLKKMLLHNVCETYIEDKN